MTFEIPASGGPINAVWCRCALEKEYPDEGKWKVVSKSSISGLCTRGFINDLGRVVTLTVGKSGNALVLDKTNTIQQEILDFVTRESILQANEQLFYSKKTSEAWVKTRFNRTLVGYGIAQAFKVIAGLSRVYVEEILPSPLNPNWVQLI